MSAGLPRYELVVHVMGGARPTTSQLRYQLEAMVRDRGGHAAIEFALIGATLCYLMLNLVDVGRYIYTRMEVQNAAQIGAHAASSACDVTEVPATILCSNLAAAVIAAVQSTSLGDTVSLQEGSPSEGYYCIDASGALKYVSAVLSKPTDCSATGMAALQPGDYVTVDVTYSYAPIFEDLTVARFLPSSINETAHIRLE